MVVRKGIGATERAHHRDGERLGEPDERLRRARGQNTAAQQQQRALRHREQLDDPRDRVGIWCGPRRLERGVVRSLDGHIEQVFPQ